MGWQKRGKGFNSNTGQGAVMGLDTGKVIDYTTKLRPAESVNMQQKIMRSPEFMTAGKTIQALQNKWNLCQPLNSFRTPQTTGCLKKNATEIQQAVVHHKLNKTIQF
jgi:hypothetical protein